MIKLRRKWRDILVDDFETDFKIGQFDDRMTYEDMDKFIIDHNKAVDFVQCFKEADREGMTLKRVLDFVMYGQKLLR
jgi:hypothetical protein